MIKESLDSKAGLSSTNKAKSLVYAKFDQLVPKLGDGLTWPGWAISKAWKDSHPQEYQNSLHLIDPKRTVMPNITDFTQIYAVSRREYLPSIPPGVQLPENNINRSTTQALLGEGHSGTHFDPTSETDADLTTPAMAEQFQVGEELALPPPPL